WSVLPRRGGGARSRLWEPHGGAIVGRRTVTGSCLTATGATGCDGGSALRNPIRHVGLFPHPWFCTSPATRRNRHQPGSQCAGAVHAGRGRIGHGTTQGDV